jgi:hypothetical protein
VWLLLLLIIIMMGVSSWMVWSWMVYQGGGACFARHFFHPHLAQQCDLY